MARQRKPLAINPPSLGEPRGYSNGMLAAAGGRLLAIAGQIAWDEGQNLVCDDFRGQFAQALTNLVEVVRAAGGEPDDVVQLTIYVVDRQEYLASRRRLGEAYRLVMGEHYPAMALVEVSALLEPGAKVEIQGLAVIPPERRASNRMAEPDRDDARNDDFRGDDTVTDFPAVS